MRHIFIAMTNAVEGKDAEFNAWYDDVHFKEVLATPGFISAQRYRIGDAQIGSNQPYRCLAVYELETDDPAATLNALREQSTGFDTSLLAPGLMSALYTPVGPRVTADDSQDATVI